MEGSRQQVQGSSATWIGVETVHTGGRSSGIVRMNYGLYAWRNVAAVIRLFFIQKL